MVAKNGIVERIVSLSIYAVKQAAKHAHSPVTLSCAMSARTVLDTELYGAGSASTPRAGTYGLTWGTKIKRGNSVV